MSPRLKNTNTFSISLESDVQTKILLGVTHWQSLNYFAYFPSNSNVAGFLREMLSAEINSSLFVVIFLWWLSSSLTAPSSAHNHYLSPSPIGTCFYHIHSVSTTDGYQIHKCFSFESFLQGQFHFIYYYFLYMLIFLFSFDFNLICYFEFEHEEMKHQTGDRYFFSKDSFNFVLYVLLIIWFEIGLTYFINSLGLCVISSLHCGWSSLFRGKLVNVIRVAPSKSIEVQFFLFLFNLHIV